MSTQTHASFIAAINEGNANQVSALLRAGADVNKPGGEFNLPPLQYACWQGSTKVVRMLVEYGADVDYNAMDEGGPLTFAAASGNTSLLSCLLDLGALVDTRSPRGGETALHKAVFRNRHETVELLISHGADVNATTQSGGHTAMFEGGAKLRGEGPLHLAAAYADAKMIRILLDAGADRSLTDDRSESPLAWAGRHQRDNDVLELL